MSQRLTVLHSYRKLLKIIPVVFKNDKQIQQAAINEIKTKYNDNKTVNDKQQIDKLLQESNDTYEFLLKNIIQIQKKDKQHYTATLRPEHTTKDTKPPEDIL